LKNKMNPICHFILGLFFSFLLFFLFPTIGITGILIIFLSSFLIDFDHYLYYIYKKWKFNPLLSYNWYKGNIKKFHSLTYNQQKKVYIGIYIFHGIEVLILLFLLGNLVSNFFTFVFIGFLFHLCLDITYEAFIHKRLDKISLIYNHLTFKKYVFIEEI
jgi:hypothetical protein